MTRDFFEAGIVGSADEAIQASDRVIRNRFGVFEEMYATRVVGVQRSMIPRIQMRHLGISRLQ